MRLAYELSSSSSSDDPSGAIGSFFDTYSSQTADIPRSLRKDHNSLIYGCWFLQHEGLQPLANQVTIATCEIAEILVTQKSLKIQLGLLAQRVRMAPYIFDLELLGPRNNSRGKYGLCNAQGQYQAI